MEMKIHRETRAQMECPQKIIVMELVTEWFIRWTLFSQKYRHGSQHLIVGILGAGARDILRFGGADEIDRAKV